MQWRPAIAVTVLAAVRQSLFQVKRPVTALLLVALGVLRAPALAVDGILKATGTVSAPEEIRILIP